MDLYQKPCLIHKWLKYLIIFLQGLVCCLLVEALLIGGGDIMVSGCQKVGFYNYCFYNEPRGECECMARLEELSLAGGPAWYALVSATILTYSTLVTVLVAFLAINLAHCCEEDSLWMFAQRLNLLSLVSLILGMTIYLSITRDLIDISQITPGFLALLVAISTLAVLCWIIRHNYRTARGFTTSKAVIISDLV